MLVTELLGPTLEDLFNLCKRKFSLKTVLQIAIQMISRIEYMHAQSLIHRDIKPANFLIGRDQRKGIIHIMDYGLSKRFRDPETKEHHKFETNKGVTGTVRYQSINSQQGNSTSRRDDLECLSYVLIYFLIGRLPWSGVKASNKALKYKKILEIKKKGVVELKKGMYELSIGHYEKCITLIDQFSENNPKDNLSLL